jgi:hypothetical protein
MNCTVAISPPTARPWLLLSILAAALAMAGSAITLLSQQLYDDLTTAFLPQALAQDLVNLLVVSPAMIILAVLALRGSSRAYLLWLGTLLFTAYNYVIYTIGIPFGPLFLLWVGVLGMSIFALLGGAACINRDELLVTYRSARAAKVSGWALIVIALMFGALWLSEDVPALLNGTTPQSLVDQGMITNPVHVLDLAFFLPAVVAIGALWLRRNVRAATAAPSFIVFLVLTGVPILVTPIVQAVRGETAAWGVVVPIGTVTVVNLLLLAWLLGSMTGAALADRATSVPPRPRRPPTPSRLGADGPAQLIRYATVTDTTSCCTVGSIGTGAGAMFGAPPGTAPGVEPAAPAAMGTAKAPPLETLTERTPVIVNPAACATTSACAFASARAVWRASRCAPAWSARSALTSARPTPATTIVWSGATPGEPG